MFLLKVAKRDDNVSLPRYIPENKRGFYGNYFRTVIVGLKQKCGSDESDDYMK